MRPKNADMGLMGGGTTNVPSIQPVEIDGEPHFVVVMSPWQEYDLRVAVGTGGWATFPPVPVTAGQQPWNYWSNFSVAVALGSHLKIGLNTIPAPLNGPNHNPANDPKP